MGTVPAQMSKARQFVADRVIIGEAPSPEQAQSETSIIIQWSRSAKSSPMHSFTALTKYQTACVHVRLFTDRLEVSQSRLMDWP